MNHWLDVPQGPDRIEVYPSLEEARSRFGENYGGFVFQLTPSQAEALHTGQVVAFDIGSREYAGFLVVDADGTKGDRTGKPDLPEE